MTTSKITIDGIERLINVDEIYVLSRKYLPCGMTSKQMNEFVDEVIFRMSSLELDNIDTNGRSVEEYYFAACLAYAEENGLPKFFHEEDDGNIFAYCGAELT